MESLYQAISHPTLPRGEFKLANSHASNTLLPHFHLHSGAQKSGHLSRITAYQDVIA